MGLRNKDKENALPNIIIIFMDDMGYGDPGCYGALDYQTPNIDRLAAEGLRFTNFYVPQATCTASRAALLTGCYPNRISVPGVFRPNHGAGLNPAEETIAEMLKARGYATGMIGKWHLGNERQFLPDRQGFGEYYGLPYSNDMWPVDYEGKPALPGTVKAKYEPLPLLKIDKENGSADTAMIIRDLHDMDKITTLYTERAVNFIRKNKKQPFFLYFAHSMTHVPLGVSSKFRGKSKQGLFGDVMMEVDWSVGQVMHTLKDLKLADNTLVIFTSDNGPWLNFGNHAGSTAGLREGKGTSWEGGTHVPCIMRWPGVISQGRVTNALSTTMDILPLLATVTGSALPSKKIDGVNILPVLKDEKNAEPRKTLYYYYNRNDLEAVRKGNWKLVFPHQYRSYEGVLPGNDGKAGPYKKGEQTEPALYDLRRDPGERYDVKEVYPEIVKELEILAEEARKDLGDNLKGRKGENVRPVGLLKF